MQENVKKIFGGIVAWFKKLSPLVKKLIIGTVALVVVIGVGFALFGSLFNTYATLFTGLTSEDMNNVVTYLSENGVTQYRIEGQDTVLVPESQVAALKADLLLAGYPDSGFSYSTYFDNVSSLTTESERDVLKLYSLEEEMEAVIREFDFVSSAQVKIVPGEDNAYVLDSGNASAASASVLVELQSGRQLSQMQVSAIRQLVSTAVQGLEIGNITITDTAGNTYAEDEGTDTQGGISSLKLDLESDINNTVRANIINVLEPLFGTENIRVSVNSVVDMDHSITSTTEYTTEEWGQDGSTDGEGIIGSQVYDYEISRPQDEEGGVAGAEPNADINTYTEDEATLDGTEDYIASYGEKEYLVDTVTQQSEKLAGTVSDLTVSISINSNAAGDITSNDLISTVARAAGITNELQNEKIDILLAPFVSNDELIEEQTGLLIPSYMAIPLAGLALFLLIMLIVIILLLSRRKKRIQKAKEEEQKQELERLSALKIIQADDGGVDVLEVGSNKGMELRQNVREFAEKNPEIAAQMIRNWLREEGK